MKHVLCLATVCLALTAGCDRNQPEPPLGPPASAPQANLETGRHLASQCAPCHGKGGTGGRSDVPSLAGQHYDYLAAAMQAYTLGDRPHPAMKRIARSLDDTQTINVLAYYASLSTPWRQPVSVSDAKKRRSIGAGKAISQPCDSCHGPGGNSKRAGIPSLAGLVPSYIVSALKAYFNEQRSGPMMKLFSHALTEENMQDLAAYYGAQRRLRAPPPTQGNAVHGRTASTSCATCHGLDGNSIGAVVPSLAGQNAAYLFNAALAYRTGQRNDRRMRNAMGKLDESTLRDIAAYYAMQSPLHLDAQRAFDPMAEARHMANTCDACHGEHGNSNIPGTPRLSGQHPEYLRQALLAYRNGERGHEVMRLLLRDITELDAETISIYYAMQAPASSAQAAPGDPAAGEAQSAACAGCHGAQGQSTDPQTPNLAGQQARYLADAMQAYREGKRTHGPMQDAMQGLDAEQMQDLAAYFATQTAAPLTLRDWEEPQRLAEKCDRCHGEGGRGVAPDKPRIAGQVADYLRSALHEYKTEMRHHSAMHAMSDVLRDTEIDAIARYYAQQ